MHGRLREHDIDGTCVAMTPSQLSDLELAHKLADAARSAILPFFRTAALQTDNKDAAGFDPVTQADRAAEEAMRDLLAQHRAEDGIWGEEFGLSHGSSGRLWVLDPIDGTRAFISGTPTWGVLIALGDAGQAPHLGMVDQPYIGERFWGDAGGAFCSGPSGKTTLSTCAPRPLQQATLFTTFPEVGRSHDRQGFEAVAKDVQLVRYGMDCYAYALLAAGQVDLVIEAELQAYDIQGPMAVIAAAGGVVTNWRGGPAHEGGQILAAANAQIHKQALERLLPFAD